MVVNHAKRKRSRIVFGLFVLCVIGCSSPRNEADSGQGSDAIRLSIATGTTSGVYYPLGNALARLWSQRIPGLKASAQATSASVQNMNLLHQKEAEVAFTLNSIALYAYEGKDYFHGRPIRELRGITHLYPNAIQLVVRADSDIHSVEDLKGKRFVPGAIGSGTEVNSREILEIHGLNFWDADRADVKADYVGFTEAIELLKNHQVDAALISAGIPNAALIDLSNSADVRLLSFDSIKINKITHNFPVYFPYRIPAQTYPGQKDDIETVAQANLLVTRADLDEDLVYNLTRTIYEGLDELSAAHSAAKSIRLTDALKGIGSLPLHPGAERYYRENGVLK